jgi:hypothetical protein
MGLASLYMGFATILSESFGGPTFWMPLYMLLLVLLTFPSLVPASAAYWSYLRVLAYISLAVLLFSCLATLQYADGNQIHSSNTPLFKDGFRGFLRAIPLAASSLLGTEMNVFISADVDEVSVI